MLQELAAVAYGQLLAPFDSVQYKAQVHGALGDVHVLAHCLSCCSQSFDHPTG